MKPIRIGMLLNEPPLPFISAATRSFAAVFHEMKTLEMAHRGNTKAEITKIFATSTDLNRHRLELEKQFPEFHQTVELYPPGAGTRWRTRLNHLLKPQSYLSGQELAAGFRKSWVLNEFDIAHVELAWPTYALPAGIDLDRVLVNLHYFLKTDFHAAQPAKSLYDRMTRRRLLSAELKRIRKYRHFRVLSIEMADTLREMHPSAEIYIIPLPIQSADYKFRPRVSLSPNPTVTCIGSMFWPPSQAAAQRLLTRLWPGIKARVPTARLQIVGRDAIRHFGSHAIPDEIEIIENVPEIEPYFHQADVLVYAPPAGSGMKVKVQESMLYGLPVVTNRVGTEGLNGTPMEHYLVGETDEQLMDATVQVLTNQELSTRLSVNGRQWIELQCSPKSVVSDLISVYENMNAWRIENS